MIQCKKNPKERSKTHIRQFYSLNLAQESQEHPSTAQYSSLQPTTSSTGIVPLFTVQTVFCTETPWSCVFQFHLYQNYYLIKS